MEIETDNYEISIKKKKLTQFWRLQWCEKEKLGKQEIESKK